MSLDLNRLEKVKRRGANTIARCPACAEAEADRKGEHLFINPEGRFGCVQYPGAEGQAHRKRIFALAGMKEMPGKCFEVRSPLPAFPGPVVIQKDILGRLGHTNSTHARKSLNSPVEKIKDNLQEDSKLPVPSVPSRATFTPQEEGLLIGEDAEFLGKVRMIKEIFNVTVERVIETKP